MKKYTYYITNSALEIIKSYKQLNRFDNESGGILLGQIKENEIYIIKVSVPNKFDKASRNSFNCNKDAAQVVINYEFKNSGHKTIYIGEWHTHPEKYPNPSMVDKKMISGQYFKNKLNEPFLILMIQGLQEIYCAIYKGEKLERIDLTIIND